MLADKLELFIRSPRNSREMGLNSRKKAEAFSMAVTAELYRQLFQETACKSGEGVEKALCAE